MKKTMCIVSVQFALIALKISAELMGQASSKSVNDIFFAICIFVFPIVIVLLTHNNWKTTIFFTTLTIFFWIVIYSLHCNYHNMPWFQDDPNNCDGQCYGWYTFEDPPIQEGLLFIGIFSICTAIALKLIINKIIKRIGTN